MANLLVTNDDGIDAPGIAALFDAVREEGEVRVYAPMEAHSGCSHKLTTDDSIRVDHRQNGWTAIGGTPGDCVRLALHLAGTDADWVLAGINEGGNLGVDVYYSGTVAAVREAAIHGFKGIAFSQYIRKGIPLDWERAKRWASRVFHRLKDEPLPPGSFWSVNFPHLEPGSAEPEFVHCPLDTNPLPLAYLEKEKGHRYSGVYSQRPRTKGSDVDCCFSGQIAITRLSTCHGSIVPA